MKRTSRRRSGPRPVVYFGRTALDFCPPLVRRLARVFGASEAEARALEARLQAQPWEPPDIALVLEAWPVGSLALAQESDWDWHDLRGIHCRRERLEVWAVGLPADEHFRLEEDWSGTRVSVCLRAPRRARVMRILRATAEADAWRRRQPRSGGAAPFARLR